MDSASSLPCAAIAMNDAEPANPRTGWAALRHRGFALLIATRVLSQFGTQIIAVAVGWQIYDLTRNPADLGLVGLFQFAPALLLVLVAGVVSDRFNRRTVAAICLLGQGLTAVILLYLTATGQVYVWFVFALLF